MTEITPLQADTILADAYGFIDQANRIIERSTTILESKYSGGRRRASAKDEMTKALGWIAVIREEIVEPLATEYSSRYWSRFFLVTSSDGHVHSSMSCHTCLPTTQYAWLTDLSGKSEGEAVEAHGEKMCTECFPSAPAHPAFIKSREEREALEAAKLDGQCPSSGTYGDHDKSICAAYVTRTSTGKIRSHKLEKIETHTIRWFKYDDAQRKSVTQVHEVTVDKSLKSIKDGIWRYEDGIKGTDAFGYAGYKGNNYAQAAHVTISSNNEVVFEKGGWVKRRVTVGA